MPRATIHYIATREGEPWAKQMRCGLCGASVRFDGDWTAWRPLATCVEA